jgi:hypothetical protein
MFDFDAKRLLRTHWGADAQSLAEELISMMTADTPLRTERPLELRPPAGVPAITIFREGDDLTTPDIVTRSGDTTIIGGNTGGTVGGGNTGGNTNTGGNSTGGVFSPGDINITDSGGTEGPGEDKPGVSPATVCLYGEVASGSGQSYQVNIWQGPPDLASGGLTDPDQTSPTDFAGTVPAKAKGLLDDEQIPQGTPVIVIGYRDPTSSLLNKGKWFFTLVPPIWLNPPE